MKLKTYSTTLATQHVAHLLCFHPQCMSQCLGDLVNAVAQHGQTKNDPCQTTAGST